MNKIRLTESELNRIINGSIKKCVNNTSAPESEKRKTIKESYDDIDFSKTPGIDLSDADVSPREIKEKVLALQTAIKDVMNICFYGGKAFNKEMWDRCYDFYKFISEYYIELNKDCRNYKGSWTEDHSDIPFIRKYGEECSIPNYYGKDGNRLSDDYFKRNFKPHNK